MNGETGLMDSIRAVLKAYFTSELVRSSGFIYGMLSMSLWIVLFVAPIELFASPGVDRSVIAGYMFTAVLVFSSYSTATWDLAWEIRWSMRSGVLEYYIVSGRSPLILIAGVAPVSLIWLAASLTLVYSVFTLLLAPPAFIVENPLLLLYSFILLGVVLLAHTLVLAGSTLSTGTSGPVMELISWILPIATGGLTPLSNLPEQVAVVALLTPYAYPAELVRRSLLNAPLKLPLNETLMYGTVYSLLYLAAAYWFFMREYRRILREGVKTIGMY
ncbi:MAG: ABC transporter permease [Desulfurococcus sp.]|nr:ABC transporter permease [Desulfurococcus sp.]